MALNVAQKLIQSHLVEGDPNPGEESLPFRSNIPRIAEFLFERIDETYHQRALASREGAGHAIVAGANYGQGSSREHAARGADR
jgi:hypothetical protein